MRRSAALLVLLCGCMEDARSYLPPPQKASQATELPALPRSVTQLRLGLVPFSNPLELEQAWSKMVAYLQKELKVPIVVVMGTDYDDAGKKMEAGEIDLASFSPYEFVRASRRVNLRPLVTVVSDGSQTAPGYILVRADSPRRTLDELKGGSFGFVDKASTSGYLYPVKLMLDRGWDPRTAFSKTVFFGNHEKVLLAIHDGTIDAGATYYGAMKALKAQKGIDPLEFRVVAKTERTPHDVIAMRADADPQVGRAVAAVLLRLSARDEEGRALLGPLDMNGFYPADERVYDRVRAVSDEVEAKER